MRIYVQYAQGDEMKKDQKQQSQAANLNSGANSDFPIPVTLEMIRKDILTLFFQQARTIGLMTDEKTARSIFNLSSESDVCDCGMFNPEMTYSEYGLTYDCVQDTEFAKAIEFMYQYGCFGIALNGREQLGSGGIYTWISAILFDMNRSMVINEWEESHGSLADIAKAAKRCFEVAELANARFILEGQEPFHYLHEEKDATEHDSLTIHQMALLSGMEEMSVRAATNIKRVNPLVTYSMEGRTRVSREEAKKWLKSKNLYVNIAYQLVGNKIDLTKLKFSSAIDLLESVQLDISTRDDLDTKNVELAKHLVSELKAQTIQGKQLNSEDTNQLANLLKLDSELLNLRIKEAIANEALSTIQSDLNKHLTQSTKSN